MVTRNLQPSRSLPSGVPDWITPELVQDTLDTWQAYYRQALTESDAVEILRAVGRFLDLDSGATP